MSNYNIGLIQVHIAVLLFGAAGLFGEWLEMPSSVIVFGRVFFGALALLAILGVRRERILLRQASHYRGMMVTGVVLAVHWVTFFQSIQVGGVAIGLISYATFPMFVIFLDPLFTRNRIRRRDVVVAVVTVSEARPRTCDRKPVVKLLFPSSKILFIETPVGNMMSFCRLSS